MDSKIDVRIVYLKNCSFVDTLRMYKQMTTL